MEQIVMFKWENKNEYKYRCAISEIGIIVGELMNKIFTYAGPDIEKYKIYINGKKTITLEYSKLFNLSVPFIYAEIDKYLRESHLYYLKALDILTEVYSNLKYINNKKNIAKLNEAGTYITVGNSFVTIVRCKSLEMFERQQAEYNKSKSFINNVGKSNDNKVVLTENSHMYIDDKGVKN